MKTFRRLIESSSLDTLEKLVQYIEARIKEGEIVNPDFQKLKDTVNKVYEKGDQQMKDLILGVSGRNDILNDVYYDLPMYPTSFNKVKKSIKKAEKEFPNVCREVSLFVDKWEIIPKLMKELKGLIVTTAQKREQRKEVEKVDLEVKKANMSVLVKELEKNRDEYIRRATKTASERLEYMRNKLESVNNNLNKISPSNGDRTDKEIRSQYMQICKSDYHKSSKEVDYWEYDKILADRWLKIQVEDATANFDSFVVKMVQKIGQPVVKAKLTGNIWTSAVLEVETVTGETQIWNTQIILNVSKYGNLFNQFPTRRKR